MLDLYIAENVLMNMLILQKKKSQFIKVCSSIEISIDEIVHQIFI